MVATSIKHNTDRGIQLFAKKQHVKTIPKKFMRVCLLDFIETPKQKRLTIKEHLKLELFLFLEKKYAKEPELEQFLKNAELVGFRKETNYYKETWHVAVFEGKTTFRVKVPERFYILSESKEERFIN